MFTTLDVCDGGDSSVTDCVTLLTDCHRLSESTKPEMESRTGDNHGLTREGEGRRILIMRSGNFGKKDGKYML